MGRKVRIRTWFGNFYIGERIIVVNSTLHGDSIRRRGKLIGKRYTRGTEYLIFEQDSGKVFEVPLRGGTVDFIREDVLYYENAPKEKMAFEDDDEEPVVEVAPEPKMEEVAPEPVVQEVPPAPPVHSRYSRVVR